MTLISYINQIGTFGIQVVNLAGSFGLFGLRALKTFAVKPLNRKQLLDQMYNIGVGSLSIVFLTGAFTGLALALQSYLGFSRVHAEQFTGLVVTLGIARELGPVLTGLMVTGRVGSTMAAELGSMCITEQIDALKTLCIDPFYYLIVPRMLAATVMMPFVTIFTMIFGMTASYFLCVNIFNVNAESYLSIIQEYMELKDITEGLLKSAFFGFIFSWVGSYVGYYTTGGARGVGSSTTRAVVFGSTFILVSNYIISSFLHHTGMS